MNRKNPNDGAETELQLFVQDQLARQFHINSFLGRVINTGDAHSRFLIDMPNPIEADLIFPDYAIVCEFVGLKSGHRVERKRGNLKEKYVQSDLAKTIFYANMRWIPFWVKKEEWSGPHQRRCLVETLANVCRLRRFHPRDIGVEDFEYE